MNSFIESQNWRYATKQFDATQKISADHLAILKEAVRLSPSSMGLQPYKVIVVDTVELRSKLVPAAYGQAQVVDASHLFVLAIETTITNEHIDAYMQNIADTRGISTESLTGFKSMVENNLNNMDVKSTADWAAKQVYLALGNLLNAAADLRIDATPMEGFNPKMVNEILGLESLGLSAVLLTTLGYRHENDKLQHLKKVRKNTNELFITL
ncbi:MAG: NAD(P)H-dependent oxidoreductase [Flavobacterium sp.]|nr:NAD(P)H-dependent oxidoreductase [Flavobacterium sp.]